MGCMATNNSASKRTTSEKPAPKRSTRKRTTRTQTAATANSTAAKSMAAGEVPAPTIPVTSPEQFGRIVVMDVTPSAEQGMFPARVELGEPFEVTAQVFIEGRTKVGATAVLRNPRGREMQRAAMTCANPGLDRWTVMLQAGEHSDLKPWDEDYAAVKRQLGEWTVTIEGWEDTYTSWLHDARIKVQVGDDVENALETGAEMLNRWAHTADAHLSARDRKHLEQAAERMSDKERPAAARLAEADNPRIEALHKTHPLRDGISESRPQRFKVERPKSSFAAWYQFFPRSEGAYRAEDGTIVQGNFKTALTGLDRAAEEGVRHRLPAADLPDRRDQPQGPQQFACGRPARPGLPVRHRLRARRP